MKTRFETESFAKIDFPVDDFANRYSSPKLCPCYFSSISICCFARVIARILARGNNKYEKINIGRDTFVDTNFEIKF